jgi:ribonuclease D
MMMLYRYVGVMPINVYCTKIASKLVRTYSSKHSLAELCRELLDIEVSKELTSSDWGSPSLTEAQLEYAAIDVLHLHKLKERLDTMLDRESRSDLARRCFEFLGTRVELDLLAGEHYDIFSHREG